MYRPETKVVLAWVRGGWQQGWARQIWWTRIDGSEKILVAFPSPTSQKSSVAFLLITLDKTPRFFESILKIATNYRRGWHEHWKFFSFPGYKILDALRSRMTVLYNSDASGHPPLIIIARRFKSHCSEFIHDAGKIMILTNSVQYYCSCTKN